MSDQPFGVTRRKFLHGVGGAAALSLAACGSSDDRSDPGPSSPSESPKSVQIVVSNLPAKQTYPDAHAKFLEDVKEFERLNPGVTVEPRETGWQPDTFPARLAGGQLETVFNVPVTEAPTLIQRGQVAEITPYLSELEGAELLNEQVTEPVNVDGAAFGIPLAAYAIGFIYHRELFAQADLDPDDPPRTWDAVREAARAISELGTEVSGFAVGTKNGTEGGGMYATINASFGDDTLRLDSAGKLTPTFQGESGQGAMQLLHDLRWADEAWPSQSILGIDDVKKLMATDRLGMWIHAPNQVQSISLKFGADPENYGLGALPQAGGMATQGGGSVALFNPKATKDELAAATRWIWFSYLKKHLDPDVAVEDAQALRANPDYMLGVPELPIFTGELQDQYLDAIEPYVNAPVDNYKTYVEEIDTLRLVPEPNAEIKAILNRGVQNVLSDREVDIAEMLADAAEEADDVLADSGQE